MELKVKVGVVEADVDLSEPVSPTGQYFNSSVLSISVISILEFENPIDDSSSLALVNDVFLPINPRFSSIMVEDKEGGKHWKRVEVKAEDHIKIPCFPEGLSPESYDHYFNKYLSDMAMDPLPQTKPLWEIHVIKYPTSNAAGSVVFKLHHALGDGFSLMGALLSCLQRADNPSLPLTFPNFQKSVKSENEEKSLISVVPQALSGALNTVLDFGWSVLKSSFLEDGRSPIRSGKEGVEFRPINIMTMTFSLDQIKQIKSSLQVKPCASVSTSHTLPHRHHSLHHMFIAIPCSPASPPFSSIASRLFSSDVSIEYSQPKKHFSIHPLLPSFELPIHSVQLPDLMPAGTVFVLLAY